MYPTLVQLGPFSLRTLSVFLILAFITTAFLFWRKTKDEHYADDQIFDAFLLSSIVGFISGRLGYIASQFDVFGFNVLKWFDVVSFPGINGAVALMVAAVFLYRYASKKKWDVFELLDYWVLAVAGGLALLYVGLFFDGTNYGVATTLPWGVVFPGLQEPHHPTQLYYAVFFLLLSWYLARLEYTYRTFAWYRAGRTSAEPGFLLSVFFIASAIFYFAMTWIKVPIFTFFALNIDRVLAVIAVVAGSILLLYRSGRLGKKSRGGSGGPKAEETAPSTEKSIEEKTSVETTTNASEITPF